ncbi:MAG: DUF1003 domain-containing protein [Candidatus Rokubacteria bacterium]|nr:DUF1003 domain-containing protein [Candidatus Rokubacteria bacterium]
MVRTQQATVLCQICKKQKSRNDVLPGDMVRGPVVETIRKKYPDWSSSGFICLDDLNHFRTEHVQEALVEGKGELSSLEEEVMKSLKEHELLSKNINVEFDRELTLGERVADRVAEFGGSWRFIISFGVVLAVWIVINSVALFSKPFDPYPYILLNLVLSCLAALQAPVIMMSQNRLEAKDRLRGEHDYRINLKAELEIRHLNGKMDLLLTHQWQRLLEIQEIQTELMEELVRKPSTRKE